MPDGKFDERYSRRIADACIEAMLKAAKDTDSNICMLRNGEISDALLNIAAMFAATSIETSTPRGIRLLAEKIAKRFAVHVKHYRAEMERNGTPFEVIHVDRYH